MEHRAKQMGLTAQMWIKGVEHRCTVFLFLDTENAMKKPQTRLGKQFIKILTRQGDEFVLVASSKEYDTFQVEIGDDKVMNFLCHEYPGLAYGILINTKTTYTLPDTMNMDKE